ncbi:hypothetical protein TYRP_021878 [Tyrophagus putrescentiae]|nr:hypothetical protein TYRP_021878 [Tyrophagus putrescentiae]
MSSSSAKVVPEALSGKFKGTFAYKTLTDRLPVIITKAIDLLCRQRKQIPALLSLNEKDYDEAEEETKSLIEELARLNYDQMPTVAADMYGHLCKSDFVLFKGDLNYRKLVGDLNWPFTTSFKDSLRQFQPTTAVCSLRTIKADVVVGIKDEATLALVQSLPKTWMETGEYAVVHFLSNIS